MSFSAHMAIFLRNMLYLIRQLIFFPSICELLKSNGCVFSQNRVLLSAYKVFFEEKSLQCVLSLFFKMLSSISTLHAHYEADKYVKICNDINSPRVPGRVDMNFNMLKRYVKCILNSFSYNESLHKATVDNFKP